MNKLSFHALCAAVAGLVSLSPLAADPLPPETPLVTDGPVVVSVADVRAALLKVPPEYRAEVMMNPEHISTLIDQVYVARELALRARKEGLDQDPVVQKRMQQVQEAFLADVYVQKIQKEATAGNLDQRARELYDADPDKYMKPAEVKVQQVLVDLKGRTREMALKRAQEVYEEAKSGKAEFLELALKYSDEPTPRGGVTGDLGWNDPARFVPPVRDQLAKMKKGEVSPPVESQFGFHVLKLVDRKPAEKLAFDAVKDDIIKEEKARLAKDRVESLVREIRSSPTAHVDTEKVKSLVIPVDPEAVKRATEAAAKKPN